MNIDDIVKRSAKAFLDDFAHESKLSPVAYAVTGDPEEVAKMAAIDFTKIQIVRHDICDSFPAEHVWSSTEFLSDGVALCFEETHPYNVDHGDAMIAETHIN